MPSIRDAKQSDSKAEAKASRSRAPSEKAMPKEKDNHFDIGNLEEYF
jgi:hypothetical protein